METTEDFRKIPFSPPDITDEEIKEVVDSLKSGWITTGPKTKELENVVAKRCNTGRAACLASSTAGMEMTLRILGIGPGDEVIVPAYTYTATASVVCHVGATPVMELYVLYNEIEKLLIDKGIKIHKSYVGNYFTSLDMMGATLTVMKLDDELKELIDMPVNTMGMCQK